MTLETGIYIYLGGFAVWAFVCGYCKVTEWKPVLIACLIWPVSMLVTIGRAFRGGF